MGSTKGGPLPPVFFLGSLLLQWALHSFGPVVHVLADPWTAFGALPIVVGLTVMVFANRQFKAAHTAISPFDEPSTLVTAGPFSMSRNPMYLCMVLILFGAALAWGTLTPFLIPPLLVFVLTTRFIAMEEVAMREAFGAEYDDYRKRVRRWL